MERHSVHYYPETKITNGLNSRGNLGFTEKIQSSLIRLESKLETRLEFKLGTRLESEIETRLQSKLETRIIQT